MAVLLHEYYQERVHFLLLTESRYVIHKQNIWYILQAVFAYSWLMYSHQQYKTREHSNYPQFSMLMMELYLQPFLAPQHTVPHIVLGSGAAFLRMFLSLLMEIKWDLGINTNSEVVVHHRTLIVPFPETQHSCLSVIRQMSIIPTGVCHTFTQEWSPTENRETNIQLALNRNFSLEGRGKKDRMLALNFHRLPSLLGNTYSNVSSGSIKGEAAAQSASALASNTLLTRPAPALTSEMQSISSPYVITE